MPRRALLAVALAALAALAACDGADRGASPDDGWVDDALTDAERIAWPGVDRLAGRVVPLVNGFANDAPTSYWFFGLATPETADAFVVCREGDDGCPIDADGRLAWSRAVGRPIFNRVPGDPRYSPWWELWVVRVGPAYEADTYRTMDHLFDAVGIGEARIYEHVVEDGRGRPALVHLPLVLRGTELEGAGAPMTDGSGPSLPIERREGWRQGLRVAFFDFSASEGVFPAAGDAVRRPHMPVANIYTFVRSCEGDASGLCALAASERTRRVSERSLGQDVTGDGDTNDTNNLLGSLPCAAQDALEPAYSPLWAVKRVEVLPGSGLRLIDETRDSARSDLASPAAIREGVARGALAPPVAETLLPDAPPGGEPLFFDCPVPVAASLRPTCR